MTQAELSERSNVPATTIAHLEAGSRKPSFDTFVRLTTALEIPSDYLIGRQDSPSQVQGDSDFIRKMRVLSSSDVKAVEEFLSLIRRG